MNDRQRDFIQQMRASALDAGAKPWEADWFAAIAAHESAWGQAMPVGSHNYIGYHWLDRMGWEWTTAKEGMTGRQQRYRVFRDVVDSARSWLYLVHSSSLPGYVRSRHYGDGSHMKRCRTILRFSWQYCPADKGHGKSVYRIFRRIREEL